MYNCLENKREREKSTCCCCFCYHCYRQVLDCEQEIQLGKKEKKKREKERGGELALVWLKSNPKSGPLGATELLGLQSLKSLQALNIISTKVVCEAVLYFFYSSFSASLFFLNAFNIHLEIHIFFLASPSLCFFTLLSAS